MYAGVTKRYQHDDKFIGIADRFKGFGIETNFQNVSLTRTVRKINLTGHCNAMMLQRT